MSSGNGQISRSRYKAAKDGKWLVYLCRVGVFLLATGTHLGGGTTRGAVAAEVEGPPRPSPQWRVTATVNYSSGSYGTDSRTNIVYAPMTIRRIFRDGDISLTIPFISISGTGAVRLVGGVPTRTGNSTASAVGSLTGSGRGKKPGDIPLSSSTTDSGLGDIILRGRYYLIEEGTVKPLVALTGKIKFPTADADRGLGTGEFDEGIGVELTKRLAARWLAYLDGGYNFIGNAPGTDLHNQWWYDAGIGYDVTDDFHMSVFYEEYRALINTVNNARDLLALAQYIVNDTVCVTGSTLVGLSNGAPNYGFGVGVRLQF